MNVFAQSDDPPSQEEEIVGDVPPPPAGGLEAIVAKPVQEGPRLDHARVTLDLEISNVELEHKKAELRGRLQDIDERKKYATCLFFLIAAWLASVLVIMFLAGFKNIGDCRFALSDAVLLGLIGGTTLNVIGLFLVVVKYLFPERK